MLGWVVMLGYVVFSGEFFLVVFFGWLTICNWWISGVCLIGGVCSVIVFVGVPVDCLLYCYLLVVGCDLFTGFGVLLFWVDLRACGCLYIWVLFTAWAGWVGCFVGI